MKNDTISIYCKTYIDVFKVNEIIGTNYDKKIKNLQFIVMDIILNIIYMISMMKKILLI